MNDLIKYITRTVLRGSIYKMMRRMKMPSVIGAFVIACVLFLLTNHH